MRLLIYICLRKMKYQLKRVESKKHGNCFNHRLRKIN